MASKSEFLANAYNAAREAGLSHTAAQVAAAQAAHESRYGKSAPGNNYFGIKAGKSWTGKTQKLKTWEVVDGKKVSIKAKFRAYATPAQSFQDWSKTIARKWPGVLTATTFTDAVKALKAGLPGGYATDNLYNQKMAAYEKQLNAINLADPAAPKDAVFDLAGQTREQALAANKVASLWGDIGGWFGGAPSSASASASALPASMSVPPSRPMAEQTFGAPVGAVARGASLPAPLTAAPVGQVTRAPLAPISRAPQMPSADRFGGSMPTMPSYQATDPRSGVFTEQNFKMVASPQATNNSGIEHALREALSPARQLTPAQQAASAASMPAVAPPNVPRTVTPTAPAKPSGAVVPANPGQLGGLNYGSPPAATPTMAQTFSTLGKLVAPNAAPLMAAARAALQQMPSVPAPAMTPPPAPIQMPVAPAQVLAPALPPPVTVKQYPVAQAQDQFPAAPSIPRYTPSDIYGGQVGSAMSTGGNTVSRVDPNGSTYVTNQYGVTTATTPDGTQAATNGIPAPGTISGPLFGGGIQAPGNMGQMAKTGLGTIAGAGIGSFGGPLGSLLGAALGRELSKPGMGKIGGQFNGTRSIDTSKIGSILGQQFGTTTAFAKPQSGLAFPSAPTGLGGIRDARETNNSMGAMRDISPRAADAISRGVGGLF